MKHPVLWTTLPVIGAFLGFEMASYCKIDDEQQIRKLLDQFAVAARAKDVDKVLSFYEHSDELVIFDVAPPLQYTGWDAYREDFKRMFDHFDGPINFDLSDTGITIEGKMAYSHAINHVTGTLKDGKRLAYDVRVTAVYRKIDGKWLIVHEHISVPTTPSS